MNKFSQYSAQTNIVSVSPVYPIRIFYCICNHLDFSTVLLAEYPSCLYPPFTVWTGCILSCQHDLRNFLSVSFTLFNFYSDYCCLRWVAFAVACGSHVPFMKKFASTLCKYFIVVLDGLLHCWILSTDFLIQNFYLELLLF